MATVDLFLLVCAFILILVLAKFLCLQLLERIEPLGFSWWPVNVHVAPTAV